MCDVKGGNVFIVLGWAKPSTYVHSNTSVLKTTKVLVSGRYGFSVLPSSLQSVIVIHIDLGNLNNSDGSLQHTTNHKDFLLFSPSGAMLDTLRIYYTSVFCDLRLL